MRRLVVLTDFTNLLEGARAHVETFLKAFVSGLLRGACPCPDSFNKFKAVVFDTLFLLYSVTPENQGYEVHIIAQNFQGQAVSEQAITEIQWLKDNYYNEKTEIHRVVQKRLEDILSWAKPECRHTISRHFDTEAPIWQLLTESMRDRFCSDAPAYLHKPTFARISPDDPRRPDSSLKGAPPDHAIVSYDISNATVVPQCAPHSVKPFFTAAQATIAPDPTGYSHGMQHSPAKPVGTTRNTLLISAPRLLDIETSTKMYLHGCLRLRPDLQPLLRQEDPDERTLKLSSIETTERSVRKKSDGQSGIAVDQVFGIASPFPLWP